MTAQEFPALIDMPFVQSMDSLDVAALVSLYALSQEHGKGYLDQVTSHWWLADGITDEKKTNVVAVLQRVIPASGVFSVFCWTRH